jgi:hypothetical protein
VPVNRRRQGIPVDKKPTRPAWLYESDYGAVTWIRFKGPRKKLNNTCRVTRIEVCRQSNMNVRGNRLYVFGRRSKPEFLRRCGSVSSFFSNARKKSANGRNSRCVSRLMC